MVKRVAPRLFQRMMRAGCQMPNPHPVEDERSIEQALGSCRPSSHQFVSMTISTCGNSSRGEFSAFSAPHTHSPTLKGHVLGCRDTPCHRPCKWSSWSCAGNHLHERGGECHPGIGRNAQLVCAFLRLLAPGQMVWGKSAGVDGGHGPGSGRNARVFSPWVDTS